MVTGKQEKPASGNQQKPAAGAPGRPATTDPQAPESRAAAKKKGPTDPADYSQEQLDAITAANNTWKDKVTDADDLTAIEDIAKKLCRDARYVKDGMIFPCGIRTRIPALYCVPPGKADKGTTSSTMIDEVNKDAGTDIDWARIEGEEQRHLQAYVPWIIKFTAVKVTGVEGVEDVYAPRIVIQNGRVKGENQSGVTIATGVDLGAQSEKGLRAGGISEDLITKLTPYLGKKRADACKALRDAPLTLVASEVDALNKFIWTDYSKKVKSQYENLQNAYNKGKEENETKMIDWGELTKGQQTALASLQYQYGNINRHSDNKKIAQAIGTKAGDDEIRKKYKAHKEYTAYKKRRNEEMGWMGISATAPKVEKKADVKVDSTSVEAGPDAKGVP